MIVPEARGNDVPEWAMQPSSRRTFFQRYTRRAAGALLLASSPLILQGCSMGPSERTVSQDPILRLDASNRHELVSRNDGSLFDQQLYDMTKQQVAFGLNPIYLRNGKPSIAIGTVFNGSGMLRLMSRDVTHDASNVYLVNQPYAFSASGYQEHFPIIDVKEGEIDWVLVKAIQGETNPNDPKLYTGMSLYQFQTNNNVLSGMLWGNADIDQSRITINPTDM